MSFSLGGSKKKESGTKKGTTTVTGSEQLVIEDAAVQKIIEDSLAKAGGLGDIFQGEQTAGIFDSSVAAGQASDFTANVVAEIAKLTAERKTTKEVEEDIVTTGKQSGSSIGFGVDLVGAAKSGLI